MINDNILGRGAIERGSSDALTADAPPFRLEDYAGLATWDGKPIYTPAQVIGQLDSGREISGKTITFSFFDGPHSIGLYNNPNYEFPEPAGYSPFSEAQREAARHAMKLWDDLIPQSIRETNGNGADILFANTTSGPAQAHAYLPGNGPKIQGDVWIASPEANWSNQWLGLDGYGATTLVHEAGHALGLSHPGDYNFGEDEDGDGEPDPITYDDDAVYAQDTMQYTIMSYFLDQNSGGQAVYSELGLLDNPQTPLLHDILTIQAKYGADPTTRAGNTTYGFNSNAGDIVYDFTQNHSPYLSIYDAGGLDTLDLSGAGASVFLDLRPGAFSSAAVLPTLADANAETAAFNAIYPGEDFALWTQADWDGFVSFIASIGASRVAADTGVAGVGALSHRNISIAYNTVIEHAVGGQLRDYLVGNHVGNQLSGLGGDDVLDGLGGGDTLIGGLGRDVFQFQMLGGTDVITDYVKGAAGDFIDLRQIDANQATAANDAFTAVNGQTGVAGQAAFSYSAAANQTTIRLFTDADSDAELIILVNGAVTAADGVLL